MTYAPGFRFVRPGFAQSLRALYGRRETIRFLTHSNLKAGNRDKVLGHVWNLLDPLLFIAVYFVVFGWIFGQTARARAADFLTYLVIGVLAWRFLEGAVSQSTSCIRSYRGLIHAISFPKAVLPVSICLSRLYDFLWGLMAFIIILLLIGMNWSVHLLWIPLLVFVQLVFVMGLAFVVACLGAMYADTSNIVGVGMRLWFYCSPIFYYATGPHGMIPDRYVLYYMLNPVACFFEAYRSAFLHASAPQAAILLYLVTVSVGLWLVGFVLFTRREGEFSKYV